MDSNVQIGKYIFDVDLFVFFPIIYLLDSYLPLGIVLVVIVITKLQRKMILLNIKGHIAL